jgi:hypothetical protein
MEGEEVTWNIFKIEKPPAKSAPSPSDEVALPKRQINADGSVQFRCVGCDFYVVCSVDDGFDFPACVECRWFGERPHIKRPQANAGN